MENKVKTEKNALKELFIKWHLLFFWFPLLSVIAGIVIWMDNREAWQCPIVINEVCSKNFSVIHGEQDDYFDYIELYNTSAEEVALDGLYLSDTLRDLQLFDLSGISIAGKGYFLIAATGEENTDAIDRANFSLNKDGDILYLSNAENRIVDAIVIPPLQYNQVYAREKDGEEEWGVMTASPMSANQDADAISVITDLTLPQPEFSEEGGFYQTGFLLQIGLAEQDRRHSERADGNIYYTLDGSVPDQSSFVCKEEGIFLREGIVTLRARYITDESAGGAVTSATYFIGYDAEDTIVVSIMADEEDLYGSEKGICADGEEYEEWVKNGKEGEEPEHNYQKSGKEWEREANVEIFMPDGYVNELAGIRLQGRRARTEAKKRFSLYSRNIYSGSYYFPLIHYGERKSHCVYLREGFANACYPEMVRDRDVATQKCYPATAYLNGEYLYHCYLTEKFNEDYFAQAFGVTKENVIIMSEGELKSSEADAVYFDELMQAVNHDLSQDEAYDLVAEKMDIQSYIDCLAINIYLNNLDVDAVKNVRMWRTRTAENEGYGDGKWRWALYDLDDCEWDHFDFYQIDDMAKLNTFTANRLYTGSSYHDTYLFSKLCENARFRRQFVISFMDMVNQNFSEANAEKALEKYGENLEHHNSFFQKRKEYIVPYLAQEFQLQGTLETLTVESPGIGGFVRINTTVADFTNGSWSGEYFTDYPVTLQAVCEEGFRFAGWSGDVESQSSVVEITIPTGGVTLKPVFEKI